MLRLISKLIAQKIQINLQEKLLQCRCPHCRHELIWILIVLELIILRFAIRFQLIYHLEILFFRKQIKTLQISRTRIYYYVLLVINNRFQLLGLNPQQMPQFIRSRARIPYMRYRNDERDMASPLTANLLFSHLNSTTVAHNSLVTQTLILPAMALVILYGTKYLFTKQTITFGLIRAIIYCFWLRNLTVRPF